MSTMAYIRETVLELTQAKFADIAGVTQPTVSRWENGEFPPTLTELSRIRDAVKASGRDWNDAWFFESPSQDNAPQPAVAQS